MFLREVVTGQKTGNPVRYAQIVEAYRNEDGKSRHRVLLPLGRVDRLDKDQIRRLVTALSRYLDTGTMPEGGRIGEVRELGVGFVADALWKRMVLPWFFTKELKKRKYKTPIERALFALVAHRMADPGSKRACAEWLAEDAFLPGVRGVGLQHLYRAMDFLDECRDDLEKALYQHRRTLFDRVEMVFYDTTSTYFEVEEGRLDDVDYGLRQRGHSRDERPDLRQIVIGLACDQNGYPVASDVWSGDTTDAITVAPMLERLRALGLRDVVWVADRGMTSAVNLSAIRNAGLHYVVGTRLRADAKLRAAITADDGEYVDAAEGLMAKEIVLGETRYVVCFSPASAERDLKLRTAALDRLSEVLERVNRGGNAAEITENGFYRRLATKRKDGKYALDKNKLDREAQCDGTFVLEVSDRSMDAARAALAYKGLLRVESAFRGIKNTVDIRPVYHRLDRRIRAHVTLCMLAYLLERIVEVEAKTSFEAARKHLARLRAVELHFEGQTVWEASTPSPELRNLLRAIRVEAPPRVLPPRS
jgi:transposase